MQRFPNRSKSLLLFLSVAVSFGVFILQRFEKKDSLSASSSTAIEQNVSFVSHVIDGDTIVLKSGEHVRLIGIDAPEMRDNKKAHRDSEKKGVDVQTIIKMGKVSGKVLENLLENKKVRLEFDVTLKDKYGRQLAYVYLNDPQLIHNSELSLYTLDDGEIFVNATMIRSGYASPMTIPPNVKFAHLFGDLYKEARAQNLGLWQQKMLAQTYDDD